MMQSPSLGIDELYSKSVKFVCSTIKFPNIATVSFSKYYSSYIMGSNRIIEASFEQIDSYK